MVINVDRVGGDSRHRRRVERTTIHNLFIVVQTPTQRGVQISRTTLFGTCFTAQQIVSFLRMEFSILVSVSGNVLLSR